MAKRKAMKNIIYELDNDDIEISSDEEVSVPKVNRLEPQSQDKTQEIVVRSEPNGVEVLSVDSTDDSICLVDSPNPTVNGGKTNSDIVVAVDSPDISSKVDDNSQEDIESDHEVLSTTDNNKIILTEDTEADSPASLSVAGCENRIPIVTMRFKNSKLSNSCKMQVKEFIINLLKKNKEVSSADSDNDTDHEMDIWPEDLIEEEKPEITANCDDGLFFVDTEPCNLINDVPTYRQATSVISNAPDVESVSKQLRRSPKCYNCDGEHWLKDCKLPRDNARIAEKRQQNVKVGRYHIEDEQKYGHLIPGRISGALRHALGLKRNALPLHIYKMRMLGYPPGWLDEARISHSGITMFDSTGTAILDPEEEDGEISETGSKDKFDIKKILDFPGFNVPASSRYIEEAHLYGLPPMSEQDSKISMLQMLAPNAMKAYKRKKLTFFPSAANSSLKEGLAEMDLDSGDEAAAFPSVPPLPDEAPPPLPPPPEQPPPPPSPPPSPPADNTPANTDDLDNSDVEITSVMRVSNIPIPEDSLIVIDECYDSEKPDSGKTTPTLDDLEKKKRELMDALEGDVSTVEQAEVSVTETETNVTISETQDANITVSETQDANVTVSETDTKVAVIEPSIKADDIETQETDAEKTNVENNDEEKSDKIEVNSEDDTPSVSSQDSKEISDNIKGQVKTTLFGTPVLNITPFVKLPSDDKFAKHICDVINFENLPNSTGKYKKIRNMLKKVKTEVDRIQDS